MNGLGIERKRGGEAVISGTAGKRLSGPRLTLARIVWLALVVPSLALFVASLPVYYAQIQRACVDPVTCNIGGALTAKGLQQLPALGLSVSGYALLLIIFFAIIVTMWSGIGFLIFWRRSDEWFALFTAFFLVIFNAAYPGFPISALALAYPALYVPITVIGALGLASIICFLVLFPNGQLVPRWMGFFLVFGVIGAVSSGILPPTSPFNSNNWPSWLSDLSNVPVYVAVIFSQIYRYLRVSTRVERQQTKWVVFGILIVIAGISVLPLLLNFFSPTYLSQPNIPSSAILSLANYPLVLLLLPITVGIAILRYRLYDIDVLINRTLVYGTLTILLALVYVGLVIGLGSLVRLFTGQASQFPIVIVASTLAIAALFQPLRRRIQTIIDRRFYRRKYDAAKIIEAFSTTLRNEVDLNQLSEHLVEVVEDAMQPAHVSLWLRPPEGTVKH
ncbi:MAG TPA: hypothetical protein VJ761_04030 [Ktedonobacteraceae bacterium]|nr:hypothetical protein [Ktedonobacteraceae bacterium]